MQANPTAVVILALAVVVIIVAYKGTQENFVAAILGHAPPQPGTAPSRSVLQDIRYYTYGPSSLAHIGSAIG